MCHIPHHYSTCNIIFKELQAIAHAILCWGPLFRGHHIACHTDSQNVHPALQKLSIHSAPTMELLCQFLGLPSLLEFSLAPHGSPARQMLLLRQLHISNSLICSPLHHISPTNLHLKFYLSSSSYFYSSSILWAPYNSDSIWSSLATFTASPPWPPAIHGFCPPWVVSATIVLRYCIDICSWLE